MVNKNIEEQRVELDKFIKTFERLNLPVEVRMPKTSKGTIMVAMRIKISSLRILSVMMVLIIFSLH